MTDTLHDEPLDDSLDGSGKDVVVALERAAVLQREVVAATRAPATPREVRAVQDALREAWEPAPRAWLRRSAWLAAGVLLVLFAVWRARGGERTPTDAPGVVLGRNGVEILAPRGPVEAFTALRWRTSTRGVPRFEVRIYDEESGTLLLHEPDVRATELALADRAGAGWRRIRIEIDELDASGEPAKVGRGSAWLR